MQEAAASGLNGLLGTTIVIYVVLMFAISFWAKGQIHNTEDFLVAGRRLPLSLAWATLLATWFGAGTLLTAADEVRRVGLKAAALEPVGAGLALIITGFFFAKPLWRMGLLTIADYFKRRFGSKSEVLMAGLTVPAYFGWIAAQYVALAGMLQLFWGIDMALGIVIVAAIGTGYTLIGGMWSVTLTDAVQISLVLLGLVVLGVVTLVELGNGDPTGAFSRLAAESPPELLTLVPAERLPEFVAWSNVLIISAIGNIPGQDLMQRVFSAKSEVVAQRACWIAGGLYITFGAIPVLLGLASHLLVPDSIGSSIVPALASMFLNPWLAVIFILAVMSAVLSTIDSAILSPSSVMAQNLLSRIPQTRLDSLQLNRLSIVAVGSACVVVALIGESAYSLLESAYAIGLVAFAGPFFLGVFTRRGGDITGLMGLSTGTVVWLAHLIVGWEFFVQPLGWDLPLELSCTALAVAAHLGTARWLGDRDPAPPDAHVLDSEMR